MSNQDTTRPLSPHIQIYKPMLTMMMSIFHRITGVALYFGTIVVSIWLLALADGDKSYTLVNSLLSSVFGQLFLLGYSWVLIHHMLGGVRHFIWDSGRGFEPKTRELLARLTIFGSIGLTFLTWLISLGLL